MVYDVPIAYINGNGNLYMSLYVDEKIDGTIYPSRKNVTVDVITAKADKYRLKLEKYDKTINQDWR